MLDRAETKASPAADDSARHALQEDAMKSSAGERPALAQSDAKSAVAAVEPHDAPGRWTRDHARQWYQNNGWLVGSNFVPSDAINQLEMWQKDTFNPKEIDRELGWAQGLGMNTMRVFLHDQLWQQDPDGFKDRINQFLTIADKHHIKPVFVLFDSCWDPNPHLGKQHDPVPGVHNSGWVQGPGKDGLTDPNQKARLESYVKGVVGAFGHDNRVLMWDVWNEPDNMNDAAYMKQEPRNKVQLVQNLLPQVFQWARAEAPDQPLTSGVWIGDWSTFGRLNQMQQTQLENSDVISFHNYGSPQDFENRVHQLSQYDRPEICTEYMARPMGSTFDPVMSIAKKDNVGVINWGFVQGKTQTYLPWDSWQHPYEHEPDLWFHDIFRKDGTPYDQGEIDFIKQMTGVTAASPKAKS
jgi:hypothetical protein